jgi:ubiquinone/menaquinone biosynthesis C-methylase UbiE
MNFKDHIAAKLAYKKNKNVTSFLKKRLKVNFNTPEIILAAYDLQAGTYSKDANDRPGFYEARAEEVYNFIDSNIANIESMLDVGSGELTMFGRVASKLSSKSEIHFFATDISLSRLTVGRNHLAPLLDIVKSIDLIVADTAKLPFATKSVDVVTSDHSLEPNRGHLSQVLQECFRVARRYCVFVEPSNSLQTVDGVKRMRSLGYIFELDKNIKELGGKIVCEHITANNYNELNKSKMLLVEIPKSETGLKLNNKNKNRLTYPGTNYSLNRTGEFFFNKETGFLFPVVDNVALLLEQNRILFSKYKP